MRDIHEDVSHATAPGGHLPLVHRPVGLDNGGDFGASFGNLAGSVAVARNTVYVGSGAYVGAYRPAIG